MTEPANWELMRRTCDTTARLWRPADVVAALVVLAMALGCWAWLGIAFPASDPGEGSATQVAPSVVAGDESASEGVGPSGEAGGPAGAADDDLDFVMGVGAMGMDGDSSTSADEGVASEAVPEGPWVVIQDSDGARWELPLGQDEVLVVTNGLGENTIEVRDGAVRVKEADCGNQVCVGAGWISHPGQMIVCLPHRLIVQVVDDPADAVALG